MSKYLITGAAGFIGSNLVEALVDRGDEVVGIDNFITGKYRNIEPFLDHIEFLEGDVRDLDSCRRVCRGVDFVLHQAALGSVPRSVDDPITSNEHNVNGTLNMLVAARDAGVKRFVYAASSSAYGDTRVLPKVETMHAEPLSPYAVSKFVGELYGKVFWRVYGLPTIGLRYFNVFGRRQDPDGMYAAVIPRFAKAILRGERPTIYGDGEQTRDFNYIDNVIQANLKACVAPESALGKVFNIGGGKCISLNALLRKMLGLLRSDLEPKYGPARPGDVRDSLADFSKARELLGYNPRFDTDAGLELAIDFYKENV